MENAWNKQSENNILNSINDYKPHEFACVVKSKSLQIFRGFCTDCSDGYIEKHLICTSGGHFGVGDILYWIEAPIN